MRNVFLKIFQRKKKIIPRRVRHTYRRAAQCTDTGGDVIVFADLILKQRNGLYLRLFCNLTIRIPGVFTNIENHFLKTFSVCMVRKKRPSSVSDTVRVVPVGFRVPESGYSEICVIFLIFLLQYCHVPNHDKCM